MAWSLTSPGSPLELGEPGRPKPAGKAEREAPRDFALLQLVPHGRGGVSLTYFQFFLSPGRAFFQGMFSDCISSLRLS